MMRIFQRSQKIALQFLVSSSQTQSAEQMNYLDSKGEDVA